MSPGALPPASRRLGLAGLALGVAAVPLFGAGAPAWWLGAGLAAAALTLLLTATRDLRSDFAAALARPRTLRVGRWSTTLPLAPILAELACVAAIVVLATLMLGPALAGQPPMSGDHPVHFAKLLDTSALLADTGAPLGWSHAQYAGAPVGYLYPFLPDLWVLSAGGLLGLDHAAAYGVGFWLFWVVLGLAVYAFGKRAFSRSVGLLAAILYLTAGDPSTGHSGWEYVVAWGVWPQWLALAFTLFALSRTGDLFGGSRHRTVAAVGLFAGLALLGHQASVVAFAFAAAAAVLAWWWGPRPAGAQSRRALGRSVLAGTLALLIGAAFLWPFLDTAAMTDERGAFWLDGHELGGRLLDHLTLLGELPVVTAAGLVGIWLVLRRRPSFLATFAAFYALLGVVVGQSAIQAELHLVETSATARHLIWRRLVELGKPFFFVLAAWALVALVRGGLAALRPGDPAAPAPDAPDRPPAATWSRAAWAFGLTAALAPIAGGAATTFALDEVARDTRPIFERPHATDLTALEAWMGDNLPRDGFWRLTDLTEGHGRGVADLGVRLGRPVHRPGYTVVSNFVYKVRGRSPNLLDALNVAFAVADRPLPPALWELVHEVGPLRLYRYRRFTPPPFDVLEGAGPVSVAEWSRDRLRLDAGAGAHGTLRLAVSTFPRWHATRDGTPVPITPLTVDGEDDTGFISVPLAPGAWEFRFQTSALDDLALALTPLGLLLCLLVALADGRTRLARLPRAALTALARLAGRVPALPTRLGSVPLGPVAVVAGLGGISAALLVMGARAPALRPAPGTAEVAPGAVVWDGAAALDEAEVSLGDELCVWVLDRHLCRGADPRFAVAPVPAVFEELDQATCVTAEPDGRAALSLTWRGVPAGDALRLGLGTRNLPGLSAGPETTWRVFVDGALADTYTTRRHPFLARRTVALGPGQPHTVTIEVSAADGARRGACVVAQIVARPRDPAGSATPPGR